MGKRILFIAVVLMLVSGASFGAIFQTQGTYLNTGGGSIGFGNTYSTWGGRVTANQSAAQGFNIGGPWGLSYGARASQKATVAIGGTQMTFGGVAITASRGVGGTWQAQTVTP